MSQSKTGDSRHFELDITDELIWFGGHFPQFPVLPGIVQLRWAAELAQQHFAFTSEPNEVMRLKFKNVIVPPLRVQLQIKRVDVEIATFEYIGDGKSYSEGKIRFAGDAQ